MGCISSKIITRSSSFQEKLNQRLQRRSSDKGFPMLQEIIISRNGGDQLLALVSATNNVSEKLGYENFKSSESNIDNIKSFQKPFSKPDTVINTWELMADLEDQGEEEESIHTSIRRSKSFHLSPSETEFSFENEAHIGRSRSFHTVQEFDLMVERKQWNNKSQDLEFGSEEYVLVGGDQTIINTCIKENVHVQEKGGRRKAVAKALTSLAIPYASTIEFPVFSSLRERIEVMDSGAYFTPKFGSFGLQVRPETPQENVDSESDASVFDPELVSAFEEDMVQLKLDEEFVLQQIAEDLKEENI